MEAAAGLTWFEIVGRLLLAAGLGGVLGLEREADGQDAGFRTHLLLSLGSALFGVVSVGAFDTFVTDRENTNVVVDVTRIASYVAPGVGFIGGGAILKHVGKVKGITTAASLWVAASIGVSAGVGFWVGAVAVASFALFALYVLKPVSHYAARLGERATATVTVQLVPDAPVAGILEMIEQHAQGSLKSLRVGSGKEDRTTEVEVEYWTTPPLTDLGDLASQLRGRPEVDTIAFPGAPAARE